MSHPHNGPGPALPPVPGGHGTAPGGPAAGGTGPGVPLSIWPGLPAPRSGPHGPCAGPVTVQAAAQVIAVFSRPGDLVAVPDGSAAVIEAAAAGGRPVLGLIPAPVRDGRAIAGLRARLDPAARPFARLRPGVPALLLAAGDPDAGRAALAITGCHGPGCCAGGPEPGGDDGPGVLHAACQRVLRPGGVLAVITGSPAAPDGQLADLTGQAVASARAAGLVYAQHIVLVHAAIRNAQFAPDPAADGASGLPGGCRVHSDLLIFTKPGGTTRHD
ncbi:MAG TPA: hypothetical protein VF933_13145 [Streptosporangiaceae bacterium]